MQHRFTFFISSSLFVLLLLCVPQLIRAETVAGFAPSSFFASRTHIVAGEEVSLFTVLHNSWDDSFAATIRFSIDGQTVSEQTIHLSPGSAQTVTARWTATNGEHTASAVLVSVAGAPETFVRARTDPITLLVAAAPPPSPLIQAAAAATALAVQGAQVAIPALSHAATSSFARLEDIRTSLASAIEPSGPAFPVPLIPAVSGDGRILGASVAFTSSPSKSSAVISALPTPLLGVLHSILQSRWLFYTMVGIVLFLLFHVLRFLIRERRA